MDISRPGSRVLPDRLDAWSPDRLGPGEQLRQSKPTRMCLKLIDPHRRELTVQLFDDVEGILNDLLDLLSGFQWLSGMKNTAG